MIRITISVKTLLNIDEAFKIRCPECKRRLMDYIIEDNIRRDNKIVIIDDTVENNHFAIKCQKCGNIAGISILQM